MKKWKKLYKVLLNKINIIKYIIYNYKYVALYIIILKCIIYNIIYVTYIMLFMLYML